MLYMHLTTRHHQGRRRQQRIFAFRGASYRQLGVVPATAVIARAGLGEGWAMKRWIVVLMLSVLLIGRALTSVEAMGAESGDVHNEGDHNTQDDHGPHNLERLA